MGKTKGTKWEKRDTLTNKKCKEYRWIEAVERWMGNLLMEEREVEEDGRKRGPKRVRIGRKGFSKLKHLSLHCYHFFSTRNEFEQVEGSSGCLQTVDEVV